MAHNTLTPDEWYDQYEEASVKQQYQMLLDIMQQPLSQDFLEATEMGDLLITMSDELNSNNLINESLKLIQLVQQQQPKFYKKEFPYYDKFLIEYYLYTKQYNLVEDTLVRFKKYPINNVDELFVILDLLNFYEQPEIAVDLCKSTYNSVKNSSKVISGTEDELAWIIITNLMEQLYQKQQQGKDIGWKKFETELKKYDYNENQEWLEDTKSIIATEFNLEQFLSQLKQKKLYRRAFYALSTAFYIYMKEEKQMSFVCSQEIWEIIFDFLGDRELSFKQQSNPNTFFSFDKKDLEPYISQKIYSFLSLKQAQGFATLWGIPYLYDFLLSKEIIREQVYRKVIKITNQLKTELLKSYQDNWELWRYDFINRWQPDSNVDSSELSKQAQLFTNSFEHSEPLSDQPGEGKLESFMNTVADKLGIDLDAMKHEWENAAEEIEDSDESLVGEPEAIEITKELSPSKSKSKKKKSSLGIAAQLYNNKKK